MLTKAVNIAITAHAGQTDKQGAPYLLHVLRVMQRGHTETEKICGVLHDLVEDTPWTFDQLAAEGFTSEVIDVLRCVTKLSEEEDYDHFIERVQQNPIAIRVKINDLLDNMDITRLKTITEKDAARLNKYLRAYQQLTK